MLTLRPYQVEALDAVEQAEREGVRRPLVVHPTGTGKGVEMAGLAARRGHLGRSIVLVHRQELADQFIEKVGWQAPELSTGMVKAELNDVTADVVVASVPTISKDNRLTQLLAGQDTHGRFSTVIADEAHHAPSPSWTKVLTALGSFHPHGPLTVGFTATPERDGKTLGVWERVASYMSIREAIYQGYLVPILPAIVVETKMEMGRIRKTGGDYSEGDLGEEMEASGAIEEVADAYLENAKNRKGVTFTPTVRTAHQLAEALRERGIPAAALDGTTPDDDRRQILLDLKSGVVQVVTNCGVLIEGFDEPSISCVVISRPTAVHNLYVQMIGRGTRLSPGKADLMVIDMVGASKRHEFVGLIDLGLDVDDPRKKRDESTEKMPCPSCGVQECDVPHHRCDLCHRYLPMRAVSTGSSRHENCDAGKADKVDVFGSSRLRWLPVENGWCLGAGKGIVVMVPASTETWKLAVYENGKVQVLHSQIPADWAMGIGEDRAKAFQSLVERESRWLRLPVTGPQKNRLLLEGLPEVALPRVRTRGDAADLITRIGGRRAIRKLGV